MRTLPMFVFAVLVVSCVAPTGASDAGTARDSGGATDAPGTRADVLEAVDAPMALPDAPTPPDAPEATVDAPTPDAPDARLSDAGADAGVSVPGDAGVPRMAAAVVITRTRCALDALSQFWCWDDTGAATYYGTGFTAAGGSCAQRGGHVFCVQGSGLRDMGALEGTVLERSTAATGCTATGEDGHTHCWGPSGSCTLAARWGLIFVGTADLCLPSQFVATGNLGPPEPTHPTETWITMGQSTASRGDICTVYHRPDIYIVGGRCEWSGFGGINRPVSDSTRMTSHVIDHRMWCVVVDGSDVTCVYGRDSIPWDLGVTGAQVVGLVDHTWGAVPHVADLETCVGTATTISCYRLYYGVTELLYTVR